MTQPLSPAEFVSVAEFISASLAHAISLRDCQRHEAAARTLCGLRRLAGTIRSQAAVLGYMPEILLHAELAAIDTAVSDLPA